MKKNLKRILEKNISFLLVLSIAVTVFFSHGINAEAAYNNGKFYYDISSVWCPSAEESTSAYLYGQKYPYVLILWNEKNSSMPYQLYFTSYPLQIDDSTVDSSNVRNLNFINMKDGNVYYRYWSRDAVIWYKSASGTGSSNSNFGTWRADSYTHFMCNYHLEHFRSGQRVIIRNISPKENTIGTNKIINDDSDGLIDGSIPSGGANTGNTINNNNYNVTMDDMDKGFLQSIRDNLLGVLQNISNLATTLSNDVIDNLKSTHDSLNSLSSTMRGSILDTLTDNATGIADLTTLMRTSFWSTLEDLADSSDVITKLLREDFLKSVEDNTKAASDVSKILREDFLNSIVENSANVSSLTTLLRQDIWQSVKDNAKGVSELTTLMRGDVWTVMKDTYTGVSDISKLLREEFWTSLEDNVAAMKDLSDMFRGEFWKSMKDNLGGISDIVDLLRDKFWKNLEDITQKMLDINDFIRQGLFDKFENTLDYLFSPSEDTITSGIQELSARFSFIESTHTTIETVKNGMKMYGKKTPVIDIPISKTFLANYGVADCQISFEWFAPYRTSVLALESAFLWVAFIFRQYFGIKDLLNATGSGVGAGSSLL